MEDYLLKAYYFFEDNFEGIMLVYFALALMFCCVNLILSRIHVLCMRKQGQEVYVDGAKICEDLLLPFFWPWVILYLFLITIKTTWRQMENGLIRMINR
ncbi:TPA: hypothetical protein ACOEME_004746 [Enterobacter cloacae subsp. dissolvens]